MQTRKSLLNLTGTLLLVSQQISDQSFACATEIKSLGPMGKPRFYSVYLNHRSPFSSQGLTLATA